MAALGDLVVNLTANTSKFQRGMSQAQDTVNKMAAATAAMGAAAVYRLASVGDMFDKMSKRTGIAVEELSRFKFAAEQSGSSLGTVERSLQRMSALLLNADRGLSTAKDTMAELGIQSASLAGSSQTQRFQAFADAIAQIEDPGRRSAMAMQVFGRSGTELLPLIAEGADGFAKLAAESDALRNTVTRTESIIGADLTDAFNRVKVAGDGLFRSIGTKLGPSVIRLANVMAELLATASQFSGTIVFLGTALVTAALSMKALTIASIAYKKAAQAAQAAGGPKGWAILAGSIVAASAATWLLSGSNDALAKSAEDAGKEIATVQASIDGIEESAASAEQATAALATATSTLDQQLRKLETPAERVRRSVDELRQAMLAAKTGIVWDAHPMLNALRESESGFTSTMQSMADEVAILKGEATRASIELDRMAQAGVSDEQIGRLRKMMAERDRLLAAGSDEPNWMVETEQRLQRQADQLKETLKTPMDKFNEFKEELQLLADNGKLTEDEVAALIKKNKPKEKQTFSNPKKMTSEMSGVMQKGSVEAATAITKAFNKDKTERLQAKANSYLASIAKNTSSDDKNTVTIQGAV